MCNFEMIAYMELIQYVRCKIFAVWSQNHTKHINTLRGQNVGLLNVKPGGIYSDHWGLKGSSQRRLNQQKSRSQGIPEREPVTVVIWVSIAVTDPPRCRSLERRPAHESSQLPGGGACRRRQHRGSLSHTASSRLSAPVLTSITPLRTPT